MVNSSTVCSVEDQGYYVVITFENNKNIVDIVLDPDGVAELTRQLAVI